MAINWLGGLYPRGAASSSATCARGASRLGGDCTRTALWSPKFPNYDALSFVGMQEFCQGGAISTSAIRPNTDPGAGADPLDTLITGNGGDYTPDLTPSWVYPGGPTITDPTSPEMYFNITNPSIPRVCKDFALREEAGKGSAHEWPSIMYTPQPGQYIIINDPEDGLLTGQYKRNNFNKEGSFLAEPGEPTEITKIDQPIPEKGILADAGFDSIGAPGQRSLFKGNINGPTTIFAAVANQMTDPIHFALLFTNASGSDISITVNRRAGSTGEWKEGANGIFNKLHCESYFLSDFPPHNPETWIVKAGETLAAFLVRDDQSVTTYGPCTFTLDQQHACAISHDFDANIELVANGELQLDAVLYEKFNNIPIPAVVGGQIVDTLHYWGTYPFSRYLTGYNNQYMSLTNNELEWVVDSSSKEGKLPVCINYSGSPGGCSDGMMQYQYWWGTHGLPRYPETCINSAEKCADRYSYFYRGSDGFSEVFPITVKCADYTQPEYNNPVNNETPAGVGTNWPKPPLGTLVTRDVVGRDPRTMAKEYANVANWGVIYKEEFSFRNDDVQLANFTYYWINPDDAKFNDPKCRRFFGVKIQLDGYTSNGTLSHQENIRDVELHVNAADPTPIFSVCAIPNSTVKVQVEYVLATCSSFGLMHQVQFSRPEECNTTVIPPKRMPSED